GKEPLFKNTWTPALFPRPYTRNKLYFANSLSKQFLEKCKCKLRHVDVTLTGTNLPMKMFHVVVDGFSNNLVILTNSHRYTTESKRTTSSSHSGEITSVCTSSNPFSTDLIPMHYSISYVDLQVAN